jgi:exodeoxyribonuclease VII small subunit
MNNRPAPIPADITALSFEEAMQQLETLVRELEAGKTKLDDAISAFERGTLLRRHCEDKLKAAQLRVEQITLGADGQPVGLAASS